MRTLTLNTDDLQVESFSTGSAQMVQERLVPTTTQSREPTCTSYTLCDPILC